MLLLRRAAAPALGLAAALILLAASRPLDAVARGDQLGPGFWPRLVLAGLAATCLARLVLAWRGRAVPAVADPAAAPLDGPARARLGAAVGLLVLYVAATPWLGFPLTTALFIAAFMVLAGGRSPVAVATAAAAGTVALLYVFIKLVYLPLPKGAGPFETATLALYRALGIF